MTQLATRSRRTYLVYPPDIRTRSTSVRGRFFDQLTTPPPNARRALRSSVGWSRSGVGEGVLRAYRCTSGIQSQESYRWSVRGQGSGVRGHAAAGVAPASPSVCVGHTITRSWLCPSPSAHLVPSITRAPRLQYATGYRTQVKHYQPLYILITGSAGLIIS